MSVLTTIMGKVAGLASGGLTTVYKYAAIGGAVLALAVGAFFYGDHVGTLAQKNAMLKQDVKQEQQTITVTKVQTIVDTAAVDALQKQVDKLNADKATLQSQLKAIPTTQLTDVTTTNGVVQCVLSKSWVDMFNQSVNGISSDAGTTP